MKSILVTILFAGLLYSQSASDIERLSADVDDLGSELRNLSRTYSDGSAGGIQLNEAQLDEVRVLWNAKFDLVNEVVGGGIEVVTVEAKVDPKVPAVLEYLIVNKKWLYYRERERLLQMLLDAQATL